MDSYNNSKHSDTSSDTKPQGVNLKKDVDETQSSSQQNSQNGIDGFPLQSSPNVPNGDYVTPGHMDSNYSNSNYISQDSLSSNDEKAKTLAIVSLICGIVSLVFFCCCSCVTFPTAIAGIITGFLSNYDNGQKDNMAVAGIVCSIISIVLALVLLIINISAGSLVTSLNTFS